MGEHSVLVSSLEGLAKALKAANGRALKEIGGSMGEHALVEGDPAFAEVSVISYCCYKVIDTPRLAATPEWAECKAAVSIRITAALAAISAARKAEAVEQLRGACAELDHYSLEHGRFQSPITIKARTKLAADIYAHGASLGRACEIAGVAKQEALPYISVTKIPDKFPVVIGVEPRLALTKALFSGGN